MLHTYLMVADGQLVAQSAWLNSALARRAGSIDSRAGGLLPGGWRDLK
jgi:hypothetical protein